VTVATGVVLETGWEASTPPADTILRRAVLALAEEREQTALGQGGRAVRSERLSLADAGSPSPFLNNAVLLRPLAAPGGECLLEEAEGFYADGTGGPWMLFSPWPTPDLAGRGWELVGHPPLMLRPPGGAAPAIPPELEIRRVTEARGLAAFEATLAEGYPLAELQPLRRGRLYHPDALTGGRLRCWVGWVDGRPVSVAASWVTGGVVDVAWVATLSRARRRGYGAALTWQAARDLRGGLPAVLLASDDGRPVYQRMGFLPLLRFTVWLHPRAPRRRGSRLPADPRQPRDGQARRPGQRC
jgi:GNAT superfamily N-acetyltransferase